MATINLRDYQKRAINKITQHWASGERKVILSLPTGGGKTETALAMMETVAESGYRCLVIVDRLVLCEQWIARMKRHGIEDTGILQGKRTSKCDEARFVVATAQTIASRGITLDFRLVIIDECHYWHKCHRKILTTMPPNVHVLGLSATPFNSEMVKLFDAVVAPVSVSDLIDSNNLVPSRVFVPSGGRKIETTLAKVSISKGDFSTGDLDKAMRNVEIMGDVVCEWERLGENRPTLAFCVSIEHAIFLATEFREKGISSEVISQENTLQQRERIIRDFESGKIKILTSVNVLAVGFDSPIASCAIFARPTLSRSLHIQMAGRVIRLFAGKTDAIMLDHAGNIARHGRIEYFKVGECVSSLRRAIDKVTRHSRSESTDVVCDGCGYLYRRTLPSCPECCLKRTRTVVRVIEGELQEVTIGDLDPTPGIEPIEITTFHAKALRYGRWMGFKTNWALHKTVERFDLKGNPYGSEISKLVQPAGKKTVSWKDVKLEQVDLDWLQHAANSRLPISVEDVNAEILSFHIDTGKHCFGWQSFSIRRMRVDPINCVKVIVCASLCARNRHRKTNRETLSQIMQDATKDHITDISVVASHLDKKGYGKFENGYLTLGTDQLPFSKEDRQIVVNRLGDHVNPSHICIDIRSEQDQIFAGIN